MEARGYSVEDVYLYQENASTILLEINGMLSVGKGSRHIKIEYVFIIDNIKGCGLKIMRYPTEDMNADFYTKPLHGSAFTKHRDSLRGINPTDMPLYIKQYSQYVASISE